MTPTDAERLDWLDKHCAFVADGEYVIGPFKVGELRKLADAGIAADKAKEEQKNLMTKEEYEANPQAYWSGPRPEMEEVKNDPSGAPLWFNHVALEIITGETGRGLCLDLGCGGGRYITYAAGHFKRVIGIDFSALNLEAARKAVFDAGVENVELYNADLGDIKASPDGVADFAYSVAVFMHMPNANKLAALKELARVLKPEGRVVLIEITDIHDGAFDCPDIDEIGWHAMITEAGLGIVSESPADPFRKLVLRKTGGN